MAIPETPLTRIEQYLNRIATGDGVIPNVPLTRIEQYLNRIATKDGAIPETPLTRTEQYLNKIATGEGAVPNVPLTRTEQYLAKIAGQESAVPEVPLSRIEQYLAEIAESGGGGGAVLPPEYQQVEWIGYNDGARDISLALPVTWGELPVIKSRIAKLTTNNMNVTVFPSAYNMFDPWGSLDGKSQSTETNHEFLSTETFDFTDFVIRVLNTAKVQQNPTANLNFGYRSFANIRTLHFASLQIEVDNIVKFNGIMCYRKNDTKIGIYDTASSTFYESSGSWTKGADVI